MNVLYLCTGNSARSVMAEAATIRLGRDRWRAYSAGSHPKGAVHPLTLATLAARGFATAGLRSKSWDEFAVPNAPAMRLVVTVCDAAAGEACPIWPGRPATAHWSFPDPAADPRPEIFAAIFARIEARVAALVALPAETMDDAALRDALSALGPP